MRGRAGLSGCLSRTQNGRKHALMVGRDHIVWKAQNLKALPPKPGVASLVMTVIVKWAIRLDDQPLLQADKVHDIRSDWRLPAKFQVAQCAPP